MDRINDKTGENERNLTKVEKLTKLQICRSEKCDVRALKKSSYQSRNRENKRAMCRSLKTRTRKILKLNVNYAWFVPFGYVLKYFWVGPKSFFWGGISLNW